jgi:hypothetical protein
MVLDAIVNEDGMLVAKAPKALWGKRVKVIVREKKRAQDQIASKPALEREPATSKNVADNQTSLTQWEKIKRALHDVDALNLPEREFSDILTELQTFKETL